MKGGIDYFFDGFRLIQTKGIKRFVLVPLFVNLLLFAGALYYLIGQIDNAMAALLGWVPDWAQSWLGWLEFLLWPLALIVILVVFAYLFNTIANLIAAPFNGLLAEKMEQHLIGQPLDDTGFIGMFKDIPRTLGREITKMLYYLPRAIGYLLLLFLVPVVGQVIWFLFTAWMMAVQYCDYPFDNHKVPFKPMRQQLFAHKGLSFSFGTMVTIFAMIPVVNFLVMPVAICGATAMWVDRFKQDALANTSLNQSPSQT